jgi:hypothetical protein
MTAPSRGKDFDLAASIHWLVRADDCIDEAGPKPFGRQLTQPLVLPVATTLMRR